MKAKDLLYAVVRHGVSGDAMGIININKFNTVKKVFGAESTRTIPHGDYLFIRSDKISDAVFGYLENAVYDIIMTDKRDMVHFEEGVPIMYMLFNIED